MSFDKAFAFAMTWEGGAKLTNIPGDRGGLTKYGIAQTAHPDLDIANLTEEQAKDIYRRDYWMVSGAFQLPEPLDLLHFDAAVNHGPGRAAAFLKASGGKPVAYCDAREAFYRGLVAKSPDQAKFLKGWLNRVAACRELVPVPGKAIQPS